jgi:8-oxo-dGTP pyrophosphatase MutT (NUDIX family)
MTVSTRVRVVLLSPSARVLLIKYRNAGPSGEERPCWILAGGGCDAGETIEQTAVREIAEETGMTDVRLGPVVWYGEDGHRSGDWKFVFQEHFILAFAATETIDRSGWTEHEQSEILETRWWSLEELRACEDTVYPFALADHLEPLLAGDYPAGILTLPRI